MMSRLSSRFLSMKSFDNLKDHLDSMNAVLTMDSISKISKDYKLNPISFQRTLHLKSSANLLRSTPGILSTPFPPQYLEMIDDIFQDSRNYSLQELQDITFWLRINVSYGQSVVSSENLNSLHRMLERIKDSEKHIMKLMLAIAFDLAKSGIFSQVVLDCMKTAMKNVKFVRLTDSKQVLVLLRADSRYFSKELIELLESKTNFNQDRICEYNDYIEFGSRYLEICEKYSLTPSPALNISLFQSIERNVDWQNIKHLLSFFESANTSSKLLSHYLKRLLPAVEATARTQQPKSYFFINILRHHNLFKESFPELSSSLIAQMSENLVKNKEFLDESKASRLAVVLKILNINDPIFVEAIEKLNFAGNFKSSYMLRWQYLCKEFISNSKFNDAKREYLKQKLKFVTILTKLDIIDEIFETRCKNSNAVIVEELIVEDLIRIAQIGENFAMAVANECANDGEGRNLATRRKIVRETMRGVDEEKLKKFEWIRGYLKKCE